MIELLLAVLFTLVTALVLNIWIGTRWPLVVKVAVVMLASTLYVANYVGIGEIRGWSTDKPLPKTFFFLWAKIEEPDKRSDTEGNIYIWVQHLDAEENFEGGPRSYRMPYSIELAEKIEKAMNDTREGEQVQGSASTLEDDENQGAKMASAVANDLRYYGEDVLVLEFRNQPKAQLPTKNM